MLPISINKTLIATGICLLIANLSFAQTLAVYFMKDNGREVKVKDSADYIRVVNEPDSGSKFYNLKEFYANGKPMLIGKTATVDYDVLESQCVTYFKSGKRRQMANYRGGKEDGDEYNYYPNGKLYTYKQYLLNQPKQGGGKTDVCLIQLCNDSTGKTLLSEGNGHFLGFFDDFRQVSEEGEVKNGCKDGEWKGIASPGVKITYTETYNAGKFLGGHSVDSVGKTYTYTTRKVRPEFVGGEDALGRFLQRNINYPEKAKKNNVQGKVFLQFVVEKDGTLSNAKVLNIVDDELAAEALRVLKRSPRWVPGIYFGAAARVEFTLPVNFSLSEE